MTGPITDKAVAYQSTKDSETKKIHISFSEFSKFQSCGHRHLLEKYLKLVEEPPTIHLVFGNSIHKAIEIGIKDKKDVENRVLVFREDFYKEMHDKFDGSPEMDNYDAFMAQGENIIRYLSTEKLLKKYIVIGVEFFLYEKLFGPFHFKGFIDLIVQDRETGRYVIIDWKTSTEEWDVPKKKKDEIFMAQMRLYKYFFARKMGIPIGQIDCRYVVLNRLKSKKNPALGFGQIQKVDIFSDLNDIENSLRTVGTSIRDIHIRNNFPKAKLNGKTGNCFFCPYKSNLGLCNNSPLQGEQILREQRSLLKS